MNAQFPSSPQVTVLLPVYNSVATLAEAVESILSQSFRDFELLVVNDGSTDGSLALLEQFSARDSRMRVISQENRGIVAALNLGISEARGEFIARMDGDDISYPERLFMQAERLTQQPSLALLGSFYVELPSGTRCSMPTGHSVVSRWLRDSGNAFVHSSVMMRTSVCRSLGGYRGVFPHCEDYDLWLRIVEKHQVDNMAEYLVGYRRHSASISHRHLEQQFLSAIAARRCAGLRRNGFSDPADSNPSITLEQLDQWGLRTDEVCRLMIEWLEWNRAALINDTEAPEVSIEINRTLQKYRSMRAVIRQSGRDDRQKRTGSSACY